MSTRSDEQSSASRHPELPPSYSFNPSGAPDVVPASGSQPRRMSRLLDRPTSSPGKASSFKLTGREILTLRRLVSRRLHEILDLGHPTRTPTETTDLQEAHNQLVSADPTILLYDCRQISLEHPGEHPEEDPNSPPPNEHTV